MTGEDFDSDFEIDVCERLQALGFDVKRQIGASGFRLIWRFQIRSGRAVLS